MKQKRSILLITIGLFLAVIVPVQEAKARDIEYNDSEVAVYVSPSEPTSIHFPGKVAGGYKKKLSALSIERKEDSLIIFAGDSLPVPGEAIIVRLEDGRSFSLRVNRATQAQARDSVVDIKDRRGALVVSDEEDPVYREKAFGYAPSSKVSGLMREMVLANEFGKQEIAGYKVSDRFKGEEVLNDGTMRATIEKVFIGPTLWGYVIDASNLLEQTQKVQPASFRIDGTRAISATNWELSPKPLNIEQQISGKDKTKIYIITRAKEGR